MTSPTRRILIPAILLALAACSDLRDLWTLRSALAERFNERSVSLSLNNRSQLLIRLDNSPKAGLPADSQALYAREIASYVRDYYARFDSLQTLTIEFATNAGAGPVTITQGQAAYRFTPADLRPAKGDSMAADTAAKR